MMDAARAAFTHLGSRVRANGCNGCANCRHVASRKTLTSIKTGVSGLCQLLLFSSIGCLRERSTNTQRGLPTQNSWLSDRIKEQVKFLLSNPRKTAPVLGMFRILRLEENG